MKPDPRVRLIVVAPSSQAPYSGMLPGFLSRQYKERELFIDVARLTEAARGWFIRAEIESIDSAQSQVFLRRPEALGGGRLPPLRYDRASINTGAAPAPSFASSHPALFFVKPLPTLLADLPAIDALCQRPGARLVIIGAGAAGIELAFAMRIRHPNLSVALVGKRAIAEDPAVGAGAKVLLKRFNSQGIAYWIGEAVSATVDAVSLADGRTIPADVLWVATPAAPPAWLAETDLPRAPSGFIAVDSGLRVQGLRNVFAAGDVAELAVPRARSGVMAVRAGQYLAPLLTDSRERSSAAFRPQRQWLTLINIGDGTAVGIKGRWVASGRWVWRLKDWIDRRFMARFQPPPMLQAMEMRCEGCAAKLPGDALAAALGAPFEDAAVTEAHDTLRMRSLDGLSYLLRDPHLMGMLAVRHAVSDVWAMGAAPTQGQALIAVERMEVPALEAAEFAQVLGGVRAASARYGLSLDGGHTLTLEQPMVALAVEGEAARSVSKHGVRAGDELWLSGPIGSGILWAGFRQRVLSGDYVDRWLEKALQSLQGAAEAAVDCPVHAMTDVTGFGLAGHLHEMLGDQAARFQWAQTVPLYEGVGEALALGVQSTAAPANRRYAGCLAEGAPSDAVFDPQTAGPLLVAVSPARARALAEAWRAIGIEPHCIGRVMP